MARFGFRLQQFLRVKEQIEEQKEIEYGQALRKLEEERNRLKRLQDAREEQIKFFRESLLKKVEPAEGRVYNNTIEKLKNWITEQEKRVTVAEVNAELKRQELVEAMKERKALEKVRENAYDEFTLEEKLDEKRQVDELVSYKYTDRRAKSKTGG